MEVISIRDLKKEGGSQGGGVCQVRTVGREYQQREQFSMCRDSVPVESGTYLRS